jgi:hypothetical protein
MCDVWLRAHPWGMPSYHFAAAGGARAPLTAIPATHSGV